MKAYREIKNLTNIIRETFGSILDLSLITAISYCGEAPNIFMNSNGRQSEVFTLCRYFTILVVWLILAADFEYQVILQIV